MLEQHIKKGNKQLYSESSSHYINLASSQIPEKLSYRKSTLFNEKFRGGVFSIASSRFQNSGAEDPFGQIQV